MKYQVSVNGSPFAEIDASDDHAAVDAARDAVEKQVPAEGGNFDIEVSCAEAGPSLAGGGRGEPRAPGVVSRFSVSHEPHESVREVVEAKRAEEAAAAAKAEERAQIEAELLAKLKTEGRLKEVAP